MLPHVAVNIYRHLHAVIVCSAFPQLVGIAVSHGLAVQLSHEVREVPGESPDAFSEIL